MKDKPKILNLLFIVKPIYIISIFVLLSLVVIVYSYIELKENRRDIFHLLDENANSLLKVIDLSSTNALKSEEEIEQLLSQKLLGTARSVKRLDSLNKISDYLLNIISQENEVYRINIFNKNAKKIFSNYSGDSLHTSSKGIGSPYENIKPILDGKVNEIIIGFKQARFEKGTRYAVAIRRAYNLEGAIVVNLDASSIIDFKKKIGFENLLSEFHNSGDIEYVALQDNKKLISSVNDISLLSDFDKDDFLNNAYKNDITDHRTLEFNGKSVYEIVKPAIFGNEKIGLYRIGLSMEEVSKTESRMLRRTIIISITLLFSSFILIIVILSRQNYNMILNEYKRIKTFTGSILDNIQQGVITTDLKGIIEIFNQSAGKIFSTTVDDAIGKHISQINKEIAPFFNSVESIERTEITLTGNIEQDRIYEVNKTINLDDNSNPEFITLVINDITEIKNYEKQSRLNEKLIAMGELGSGVAHEIRNPLNSINMIAQRINKEYEPKIGDKDFSALNNLLINESKRINKIIEDFLRFVKPQPPKFVNTEIKNFFEEISSRAKMIFEQKNINAEFICQENFNIMIDESLMTQALINIIQNAADATPAGGTVSLRVCRKQNKAIFEITDTGSGIRKENLDKIFNLYFTTKVKGNGLGLSIVQQIISQHKGNIYVDSELDKGTKFKIEIPIIL